MNPFQKIGQIIFTQLQQIGSIVIFILTIVLTLYKIDHQQTRHSLYNTAIRALPIILMTGVFVGAIMVVQMGFYVKNYQINGAMGWGVGMLTFREINPLMIALMFSGRIGTFHCAELATMKDRDQILALKLLQIDPIPYLVTPHLIASAIMITSLTIFAHLIAIVTSLITADQLLDLSYATFLSSFFDYIKEEDLYVGLLKVVIFGTIISLISSYNALYSDRLLRKKIAYTVLSNATAIFLIDFLINYLLP